MNENENRQGSKLFCIKMSFWNFFGLKRLIFGAGGSAHWGSLKIFFIDNLYDINSTMSGSTIDTRV